MKLIVALGNPGLEYTKTRHNIGWQVLDELDLAWQEKNKFFGLIAEKSIENEKIIFLKPTTFYNESGQSVRAVVDFYKIPIDNILVIHDELALPIGVIRNRIGGSDAGNNGIKSVSAHVGENYARIRIGVDNDLRSKIDDADFVLSSFSKTETEILKEKIIPQAIEYIQQFANGDFAHTSSKHI